MAWIELGVGMVGGVGRMSGFSNRTRPVETREMRCELAVSVCEGRAAVHRGIRPSVGDQVGRDVAGGCGLGVGWVGREGPRVGLCYLGLQLHMQTKTKIFAML